MIGLREKLQEHPMIFMGKSVVSCRFPMKSQPIEAIIAHFFCLLLSLHTPNAWDEIFRTSSLRDSPRGGSVATW